MIGDSVDTSKVHLSAAFKTSYVAFIEGGGKYNQPSKFLTAIKEAKFKAELREKMEAEKAAEKVAAENRSFISRMLGWKDLILLVFWGFLVWEKLEWNFNS